MNRDALEYLMKWKESKFRKPLIIKGARQVGKTWLMRKFGENYYSSVAYINFENNDRMKQLFDKDYDIDRLIFGLQIESNTQIDENTLVIFDEIQEGKRVLSSLKYFYENAPEYNIIAAGSLLGVATHEGTSFPVGKVDFLDLYPMSFTEFLEANNQKQLVDLLQSQDWELIKAFKSKYIDLLRQYYFVGGMPEAVKTFSEEGDYIEVRRIQTRILTAYEQDFSKHVPNLLLPRVRMAWQSIPAQLSRENRKFVYGLVKEGARAREYEIALQWLFDMNVAAKVVRITKPDIPLNAYQDPNSFKIFVNDVGLLSTLSNLDMKRFLEGNQIFEEFKGALTEQFVFQEIRSLDNLTPHYWSAEEVRLK